MGLLGRGSGAEGSARISRHQGVVANHGERAGSSRGGSASLQLGRERDRVPNLRRREARLDDALRARVREGDAVGVGEVPCARGDAAAHE